VKLYGLIVSGKNSFSIVLFEQNAFEIKWINFLAVAISLVSVISTEVDVEGILVSIDYRGTF